MICTLLISLIVVVVCILIFLANPLLKSEEQVRESILKLTPIGTSMEDVLKVIEINKKWETRYVSYVHGISQGDLGKSGSSIVKKSIRVMIGKYHFEPNFDIYAFVERSVTVFWAFNEESKLIEIYVLKTVAGV